jgi:hypothetical protein
MTTITEGLFFKTLFLRSLTMNGNLSFFDRMMMAITFAEAGALDFEWNQELVGNDTVNREDQSLPSGFATGEMHSTPAAH